jgi:hypothetical protein
LKAASAAAAHGRGVWAKAPAQRQSWSDWAAHNLRKLLPGGRSRGHGARAGADVAEVAAGDAAPAGRLEAAAGTLLGDGRAAAAGGGSGDAADSSAAAAGVSSASRGDAAGSAADSSKVQQQLSIMAQAWQRVVGLTRSGSSSSSPASSSSSPAQAGAGGEGSSGGQAAAAEGGVLRDTLQQHVAGSAGKARPSAGTASALPGGASHADGQQGPAQKQQEQEQPALAPPQQVNAGLQAEGQEVHQHASEGHIQRQVQRCQQEMERSGSCELSSAGSQAAGGVQAPPAAANTARENAGKMLSGMSAGAAVKLRRLLPWAFKDG